MTKFAKSHEVTTISVYRSLEDDKPFKDQVAKKLAPYFKQGFVKIDKVSSPFGDDSLNKQYRPERRTEYYSSLTSVDKFEITLSCPYSEEELDALKKWEKDYNLACLLVDGGTSFAKAIFLTILGLLVMVGSFIFSYLYRPFTNEDLINTIIALATFGIGFIFLLIGLISFAKPSKNKKRYGALDKELSKSELKEKRKTAKEDELRLHSEIPFFFKMMESKKMFEIDDYLDGIEINNLIIDQRIRVSTR